MIKPEFGGQREWGTQYYVPDFKIGDMIPCHLAGTGNHVPEIGDIVLCPPLEEAL